MLSREANSQLLQYSGAPAVSFAQRRRCASSAVQPERVARTACPTALEFEPLLLLCNAPSHVSEVTGTADILGCVIGCPRGPQCRVMGKAPVR